MKLYIVSAMVGLVVLLFGGFLVLHPASTVLSQDAAANAVIAQFPALAAYGTTSLPPSFIEGKQDEGGWYVAFIERGSGVPGILSARCFYVNNNKKVAAVGEYDHPGDAVAEDVDFKTCAPIGEHSPPTTILPYGNVVLSINEIAKFKDLSLRPIEVVEDSRCPVDVQCIQAGTVRVKIEVVSSMGTSTDIVKLNQAFTTEGERITLSAVSPDKNSKIQIAADEYHFTFNVFPQPASVVTSPPSKCYVGGCSAQLCTDQPDAISTCEYTASYACYKTAACKRQTNGSCGWTPTPELSACLSNSQ